TEDLPQLLHLLDEFGIEAVVLDQTGEPILAEMNPSFISPEMIEQVEGLQMSEVISFTPKWLDTDRYIATKLVGEQDAHSLFLKVDITNELTETRQLIMRVLVLVLLIRGLAIILISHYFVDGI